MCSSDDTPGHPGLSLFEASLHPHPLLLPLSPPHCPLLQFSLLHSSACLFLYAMGCLAQTISIMDILCVIETLLLGVHTLIYGTHRSESIFTFCLHSHCIVQVRVSWDGTQTQICNRTHVNIGWQNPSQVSKIVLNGERAKQYQYS